VSEHAQLAEPSSAEQPIKPKKKKPPEPTAEERAKASRQLAEVEENEKLGRGKKLTKLKRMELLANIRMGLANAMHPTAIRAACQQKFSLSRSTVEKYMVFVKQEQIKDVGFYRHQIQELCQKALVEIVKRKDASEAAIVRAVQMLDNIFDIRVVPEDTVQAQRLIAEEAMQKMDKMNVQQLQQFTEHLRQGGDKLTEEMLMPWNTDGPDGLTPRQIKAQKRRKNRRSI
jgi:hypothetical protein